MEVSCHEGFSVVLILGFSLALSSCGMQLNKASKGALAGGALGAGTGAIIGNQTGHPGAGVAIGAGIGAVTGGLIGNSMDSQDVERERIEEQQRRQQQELERQRREIDRLKHRQKDSY